MAAASGHKSCVGVAACHYSPAPQGGAFPVRRVPLGADPSLLATILLKACGRYSRSRKCLRREVAPLAEMDLLVEDYQSLSTRLKQWQAYTTSLSKATQRFDPPPPPSGLLHLQGVQHDSPITDILSISSISILAGRSVPLPMAVSITCPLEYVLATCQGTSSRLFECNLVELVL